MLTHYHYHYHHIVIHRVMSIMQQRQQQQRSIIVRTISKLLPSAFMSIILGTQHLSYHVRESIHPCMMHQFIHDRPMNTDLYYTLRYFIVLCYQRDFNIRAYTPSTQWYHRYTISSAHLRVSLFPTPKYCLI